MKKLLLVILLCLFSFPAFAWDGMTDGGDYITIESGNLVRKGTDIEVYNMDTGNYEDKSVENITDVGSTTEVEVYDWDTGNYETLIMDN